MPDYAGYPYAQARIPELANLIPLEERYAFAEMKRARLAETVARSLSEEGAIADFLDGTPYRRGYDSGELDRLLEFHVPARKLEFVEQGFSSGIFRALYAWGVPETAGHIAVNTVFENMDPDAPTIEYSALFLTPEDLERLRSEQAETD